MATLRFGQTLRFTAEGATHQGTVTGTRTVEGRRYAEVTTDTEVWLMTLQGDDPQRVRPEGCYAARSGEGYWTCDVPGGCADCRHLAAEVNDTEQLRLWKEQADG